jgi:hypothetical protein
MRFMPKRWRFLGILLAFALLSVGLLFAMRATTQRRESETIALSGEALPMPELTVPGGERTVLRELDALQYDMDRNKLIPPHTAVNAADASRPTMVARSGEPQRRRKESVDTSGPREERESGMYRRPETIERRVKEKETYRDPFSPETVGHPQGLRKDGFHYPTERRFSVAVRTQVFAEPSSRSAEVAGLNPGDRVRGDGEFDGWVRIHSERGRAGYVRRGDLSELSYHGN